MNINGEWTGDELSTSNVTNLANGNIIAEMAYGGEDETTAAISSAHDAFQTWLELSAYERAGYLKNLHQLMLDYEEELAQTMTNEMGKPINEARGEVHYAASFIEWFAEEVKRVYGDVIPSHTSGKRLHVWKKQVGAIAAITPWNFPAAMLIRKMGPALASGCTVIMKPSSESPPAAVKLMELCEKAGFPNGVGNLITGSSSAFAKTVMENEKVRKVTFTGSTEVGKTLIKQSADHVTKLSLKLGDHAPLIVLDDADIEKAVNGTIQSKFRNVVQICICANRVYVQENIYDKSIDQLSQKVKKLKVGDGSDDSVDIGPLTNQNGLHKVKSHVNDAITNGASVATGGKTLRIKTGMFYQPTVVKDVDHSMIMMQEETFGPVIPVEKIKTDQEAAELANDTPYGLAAYVFTNNISRGTRLIENLDFGIVGCNDAGPSAAQVPFSGMKQSGVGREGGYEGIEEYVESQYVSIGIE